MSVSQLFFSYLRMITSLYPVFMRYFAKIYQRNFFEAVEGTGNISSSTFVINSISVLQDIRHSGMEEVATY
jgi:hypothetical protein